VSPNIFIEWLIRNLKASAVLNKDDVAPLASMLWPDEKRERERLLRRLRPTLPQLLVFHPFDPSNRTGPSIWLRCVPSDRIPAIYLDRRDVQLTLAETMAAREREPLAGQGRNTN